MPEKPNKLQEQRDPEALLSTASLAAIKAASPLYTAENKALRREIKRRQRIGLDVTAHQNHLANSEERLTLYNSEIALAAKTGKVPENAMTITGVVTKSGQPVEGLIVSAYDLNGEPVPPAQKTDTDGSFVLTIRKETAVRIVVSTADLKVLRCHDVTFEYESGRAHRTKINLETTEHVPIDPVYPCSEEPGEDETRTTVPDLIGMSENEATNELKKAGLNGSYKLEPSPEEEGRVVRQSPDGGSTVDRDSTVHVTLAEAEKAVVPEVTNVYQQSAEHRLRPTFGVDVILTRDGTTPGKVARQIPSAGEQVDLPHTVTIFITRAESKPEVIQVPNIVDMDLNAGQKRIIDQGFSLGPVALEKADVEPGTILSQSPKGGTAKPAGTAVAITISISHESKKDVYKHLPSVIDVSVEEGKKILKQAGFSNTVTNQRQSDAQPGTIIAQTPPGGSLQPQEAQVKLVVASKGGNTDPEKPKPSDPGSPTRDTFMAMPDLSGANIVDAKTKLQQANIDNPKLIFKGRSNTLQVTNQKPASGTPLDEKSKVTLTVSVPDAWRRDPSLAVSNLYRMFPASASVRSTDKQEKMLADKLASMPVDKVEAMLAKGASGVESTLTKAKKIDKQGLLTAIRYAVQAVRDNRED